MGKDYRFWNDNEFSRTDVKVGKMARLEVEWVCRNFNGPARKLAEFYCYSYMMDEYISPELMALAIFKGDIDDFAEAVILLKNAGFLAGYNLQGNSSKELSEQTKKYLTTIQKREKQVNALVKKET